MDIKFEPIYAECNPLSVAISEPDALDAITLIIEPDEDSVMLSSYNTHHVRRIYTFSFAECDRLVEVWLAYRKMEG